MSNDLPWNASAILVWLPNHQKATAGDFDIANTKPPPFPNPEPYWELQDAIKYAVCLLENHGKKPWIKAGDIVLTPDDISEAYSILVQD